MLFCSNWLERHRVQLRNYANYRSIDKISFRLVAHLLWLWVIQCVAAYFGISAVNENRWWVLCIQIMFLSAFLTVTTALLTTIYCREKVNGAAGFYRYHSAYLFLISVSFLELTITVSIYESVLIALLYSFIAALLKSTIHFFWIRKQVERDTYSNIKQTQSRYLLKLPYSFSFCFGFILYWICKALFVEDSIPAYIVIILGYLSACVFCSSGECWLKSVGNTVFNRETVQIDMGDGSL